MNNYISKKLAEANDKLLEMESKENGYSAQIITNQIKSGSKTTTFFELAYTYLKHLEESGKFSRISSDKPRINHFKNYIVIQILPLQLIIKRTSCLGIQTML